MRLALDPRRLDLRRFELKPKYGEKKVARETKRAPLLSQIPGYLPSQDEYERAAQSAGTAAIVARRAEEARAWRRVLAWRREAGPDERALFRRHWKNLPHSPEYALDLIRRIEDGKV
ncbi:MAG: hypothetical protein IT301_14900 [Dehalococcoidia bacterium]|nr:hypothetical protein [Dehalococcoidia bacterium]